MSPKFSGKRQSPLTRRSPVRTTGSRAHTYEGGIGFVRDPKSELFLLAASNMVGEKTFYEGAQERDERYRDLVRAVYQDDPAWMRQFIPFLRNEMFMRSAAVVAAAECATVKDVKGTKDIIDLACARADEPAELIGYWLELYGRPIPNSIKRGAAQAAIRLYNERSALKYDGLSRGVRMGDVIELTRPKAKAGWQNDLFRYLVDRTHGNEKPARKYGLETLAIAESLRSLSKESFLEALRVDSSIVPQAGLTWETLSERVPNGMTAEVWEKVIPSMGYMALLRNLRNFEQAGVGSTMLAYVESRLTDSEEVARSKQFPIRFFTAWKHSDTMRFGPALEQALNLSVSNVPRFKGRSLVLIDQSGSMNSVLSRHSKVSNLQVAALFGVAAALRSDDAIVVPYATNYTRYVAGGPSVIRNVEKVLDLGRQLGGGTNTARALTETYMDGNFNRVILVTDEQAFPGAWPNVKCPMYTFNVVGYRVAQHENGVNGKYAFGGLSDACFKLIDLLERQKNAGWEALWTPAP